MKSPETEQASLITGTLRPDNSERQKNTGVPSPTVIDIERPVSRSGQPRQSINSPKGLAVSLLENGLIESINSPPIRLSLNAASSLGKQGPNLYLRKKTSPCEYAVLLGPESNSLFGVADNMFFATGCWGDIEYVCELRLSVESLSWQWTVELRNTSRSSIELDLIYVQDVGLAPSDGRRKNEYYVSQYLERRILQDEKYGSVICCRQNIKGPTGHPYLMMASGNSAIAASVDGMQFYGSTYRTTGIPEGVLAAELAGEYSGESSILALQEAPFSLAPDGTHRNEFVATYLPDHAQATSKVDLELIPGLVQEFSRNGVTPIPESLLSPARNIFSTSPQLQADDLTTEELEVFFGTNRRHVEEDSGRLLSFYCGKNNHVVLRTKESIVDRPHAHMMQAKTELVPDENIVTTTSYMYGVFNSHISQGNTNFNRLLSVCSGQLNLESHTGQRIFVDIDGQHHLLGVPSAFEIGLNHCRWIYKRGDHCFQIRTWTSKRSPRVNMDFKVLKGGYVDLLVCNQFDNDNAWALTRGEIDYELIAKPDTESMIGGTFPQAQFRILINGNTDNTTLLGSEALYDDGERREESFLIARVIDTSDFCMSFIGEIASKTEATRIEDADRQWEIDCENAQSAWQDLCSDLTLRSDQDDIAVIRETLPWFGVNALTHYLTPHGLEQVDGGAWGTRDINQGPFELLMSLRKFDDAKQMLRVVFSNQHVDGGWPQWWMFDSYVSVRAPDCHGDIYHWCVIALSEYITTTGDADFLNEVLPYYHENGVEAAEKTALSEHVDRLIDMIIASFFPGTSLVPFDGGDWNDSMQPVSQSLAKRMISTWTVELNYQAFSAYQAACASVGRKEHATALEVVCNNIKADFNKYLVKDNTVSGHGLLEDDGGISLLLHPSDTRTNIQYRLLPMIRGIISGIFTSEQAEHHLELIEEHLKGPDGARLMNRAPKYHGGIQTLFQRAESSPYFGREIGLMYTHAHLRYAEALAMMGRADSFLKALRQATPVAYRDVVPCGDIRQSNCYYSSSDVTFKSRYEAEEKYEDLKAGRITVKGGWRIYSSGPGIFIGLIMRRLLGLREAFGNIVIDPIIPQQLNGLSASMHFMGRDVTFTYSATTNCVGPRSIRINGELVECEREQNQYRLGGAMIPTERFLALLNNDKNTVWIQLD